MTTGPLARSTISIPQDQDHYQETPVPGHEAYQETGTATKVARCRVKEIARDIIHHSEESSASDVAAKIIHQLSESFCNVFLREISAHIAELDSHIKNAQRTHFSKKPERDQKQTTKSPPKNVNLVDAGDAQSMTDNSAD